MEVVVMVEKTMLGEKGKKNTPSFSTHVHHSSTKTLEWKINS
jgi:hypothetical protein